MSRIVVFPFCPTSVSVLKYCEMMCRDEIVGLVPLRSWKPFLQKGMAASFIEKHSIRMTESLFEAVSQADSILVPPQTVTSLLEQYIVDNLIEVLSTVTNIIVAVDLSAEGKNRLIRECDCQEKRGHSCTVEFLDSSHLEKASSGRLFNIPVPVVAVVSYVARDDLFPESLALRSAIQQGDYSLIHFAQNPLATLFDAIHYEPPKEEYRTFDQCVYDINSYIYAEFSHRDCDLVLLTIPGGIQTYSQEHPEGFGLFPFLVLQAVPADYLIVQIPYGEYNMDDFSRLHALCENRFGLGVDSFLMSNWIINGSSSIEKGQPDFTTVSAQLIDEATLHFRRAGINVYNANDEGSYNQIALDIFDKLQ